MTIEEMKQRKLELGYSLVRIAELAELPIGTVVKIFNGTTRAPRHETIAALEKVLSRGRNGYYTPPEEEADRFRESFVYGTSALSGDEPLKYEKKKSKKHTIEDYYALPDDYRVELIDGVFYDMAAPSTVHQTILGELYIQFYNCIKTHNRPCKVFFAPLDVQLDCDIFTMVQPDLLVICDIAKLANIRCVYGAPDLAVEILSPSSRRHDMVRKLEKYRNAGVKEYWIVDPEGDMIIIYRFGEKEERTVYGFRDRIPIGLSTGECSIDFSVIDDELKALEPMETGEE